MMLRLKTIEGEKFFSKIILLHITKNLKIDFPHYFKMSLIGMKEPARNIFKKTR